MPKNNRLKAKALKRYFLLLFILLSQLAIVPAQAQKKHPKAAKKAVPKEVTVYVTRTGAKYHRESCSYLRYSSIAMGKNSAQSAGYTACSRCSP